MITTVTQKYEVYVKGRTIHQVNRKLRSGQVVVALEYQVHRVEHHHLGELPDGTEVNLFRSFVAGNPIVFAQGKLLNGVFC